MTTPSEPPPAGGGGAAPAVRFRAVGSGKLTDAEVDRMVALLTLAFGRWPSFETGVTPAEHLRWKTSSPVTVCAAVLGEANGELVTTDTAMGYRLRLRGRRALRIQFVDHAVRPEWRGKGVSSASIAFRQRTVAPLYDLSISDAQSPTMIHRAVKFGTRRFGNAIHPQVLPLRPRALARRWAAGRGVPGWFAWPLSLFLAIRQAAPRRRRAGAGAPCGTVVPIERFDERIDRFFAVAGEPWDLIMVRSSEHLNWRYCDARAGRFLKRVVEDAQGAILGYAVASRQDDRGFLVDLLALPGRTDAADLLIADLASELARLGCADVLCWLSIRHPLRESLHSAGFLNTRDLPSVTFRVGGVKDEDLDFLVEPQTRIHFTLGDTDLV